MGRGYVLTKRFFFVLEFREDILTGPRRPGGILHVQTCTFTHRNMFIHMAAAEDDVRDVTGFRDSRASDAYGTWVRTL